MARANIVQVQVTAFCVTTQTTCVENTTLFGTSEDTYYGVYDTRVWKTDTFGKIKVDTNDGSVFPMYVASVNLLEPSKETIKEYVKLCKQHLTKKYKRLNSKIEKIIKDLEER